MDFEKSIHSAIGLQFRPIPCDGVLRRFNIGRDEGFAVRFEDCGAFGNWSKSQFFEWDGKKCRQIDNAYKPAKLRGKALETELSIVAVGDGMFASGQTMDDQSIDRYILALTRIVESRGKDD